MKNSPKNSTLSAPGRKPYAALLVCMDSGERDTFQVPAGWRQTEVGSMMLGQEEIILLRLDRV